MDKNAAEKYIQLPQETLDKLLGHCDGNAALLYLHILRAGDFSLNRAARALKCTEAEILAAAGTLRSLGLLDAPAPERAEAPEYDAGDVTARVGTDRAFEAVVAEAERTLGRVLSRADLTLLFAVYDYWGLRPDVIMLLLHHCVEKYQARSGAGRMPTMRYIEKEAQFWARSEITTLDAAEDYLRREREQQALAGQIRDVLQIRGRELTPGEAKYIDLWLSMGFGPEAVAEAYDRTVLATGRLAWKYMDTILRSWNEKRLYTPEAIAAGDPARLPKSRPAAEPERSDGEKLDAMRRMYEHMKGGKQQS